VKGIKGKLLFLLKALFSLILLLLVLARIDMAELGDSLKRVDARLVLVLLASSLFTVLKIWRWFRLVAAASKRVAIGDAAKSYFVGMAGGLLTPGRVGEIARTMYLERQGKSLIVCLVLMDRLFDVAVVALLALPGLAYYLNGIAAAAAALALAVLLAALCFPACPLRWLQRLLGASGKFASLRQRLERMQGQLTAISPQEKARQLGLSLLGYGVVLLQFHQLLNQTAPCRLWMVVLAQPLVMLTNILPVTIGGLGMREGTAMVLLGHFNVPSATAVSAAFMLFLLNTALPAVIGSWLVLLHRKSPRA
jgi:uncharacterized protein (TIRG00374 family)